MIAPQPGGHFTHAETVYKSVYGVVKSGWKKDKTSGEYIYQMEIPANTSAEVILPDGREETVAAGKWEF